MLNTRSLTRKQRCEFLNLFKRQKRGLKERTCLYTHYLYIGFQVLMKTFHNTWYIFEFTISLDNFQTYVLPPVKIQNFSQPLTSRYAPVRLLKQINKTMKHTIYTRFKTSLLLHYTQISSSLALTSPALTIRRPLLRRP